MDDGRGAGAGQRSTPCATPATHRAACWRAAWPRRARPATARRRCRRPAGAKADADFLLAIKDAQFEDALVRASGIVVDALADRESRRRPATRCA